MADDQPSIEKERVSYTHEQAIADGISHPRQPTRHIVDYYFITKGNTLDDELKKHYKTEDGAQRAADRLNEQDIVKARELTKKQEARARLLYKLSGPSWLSEDPFSWIRKQKRYAISSWYDRDSCHYWETVDTLIEVEKKIQEEDIERVVDLDTGQDVPFSRIVTVSLNPTSS